MQIQVLSNMVTTQTNKAGKPMQVLEVAYKNLTFQGKVESKKLFDFGVQADVFKTLATAAAASHWDVEVKKNDAGYNDWIKVTKGNGASSVADQPTRATASSPAVTKGGWETPEERAKKQIYIVRQSSISAAVNALTATGKVIPNANEVIDYARQLEEFVFSSDNVKAVVGKDVGSIDTMEEDIPF
jgi:hypothetical protein